MLDLREELIRHYRWLRQYGCNDSHSGNASAREVDRFWVTPTGACADTLEAEALVPCTLDGALGEGASLDARLHLEVYRHNPNALAIFHSHGPFTVALTMNGRDFVPSDFEGKYYFERIPVITIDFARYVEEAPLQVAQVLAEYKVAVVRGHGVYAWGESINLAYKWTCSVELSAKTMFLARLAGTL